MTGEQIVLLLLAAAGVVALINLAIWVPIFRRLRALPAKFRDELAAAGDHVVLGPEPGIYRGGSASGYPKVGGNGSIALTDHRLAIRRAIGAPIDIPVSQISAVRKDRWFRSGARMGQVHVIVGLRSGGEIAFYVGNADRWLTAIETVAGVSAPAP